MTPTGKSILIRQERIPIRAAIWEVPAGQIDDSFEPSEEEIEAVALRELREETGFELASDGELVPNSAIIFLRRGLLTNTATFFGATGAAFRRSTNTRRIGIHS